MLQVACGVSGTPRWAPLAGRTEPAATSLTHPEALSLVDRTGRKTALESLIAHRPWTVLFFFSSHCPCQRAHDPRLRELAKDFGPQGVQFLGIASERDGSLQELVLQNRRRHYGFPLLLDPTGEVARAFDAQFATFTVVLDSRANVHYQGGIDSDRKTLRGDAETYLRNALDALVEGKDPPLASAHVLGCHLALR